MHRLCKVIENNGCDPGAEGHAEVDVSYTVKFKAGHARGLRGETDVSESIGQVTLPKVAALWKASEVVEQSVQRGIREVTKRSRD